MSKKAIFPSKALLAGLTISLLGGLSGLLSLAAFAPGEPVTFRSAESVTESGAPVFNRVKFLPGWNEDVWLMQQSQHGLAVAGGEWDRLAIVVDKRALPYQARFYQFTARPLETTPALGGIAEAAPLRARCFACHVSGPRAVRPAADGPEARLSFVERIRVFAWNLRIKSYRAAQSAPGIAPPLAGGALFRSSLPILSRPLPVQGCTLCHHEGGLRAPLKLEHLGTAKYLLETGQMPPFPLRARAEDVAVIKRLVRE